MGKLVIACLGDSLTYGYGVRREECWVSLADRNPSSGAALCNYGLSGDTTGGMLARLATEVIPARPHAVLLMGGANDILFEGSAAPARANMSAMAHQIAAGGLVPLIGIPVPFVPPVREDWAGLTDFTRAAAEYAEYADWLRRFCGVFSFQAVDFRAYFMEHVKRTAADPAEYFLDGLHPDAEGHRIMGACMADSARSLRRMMHPKNPLPG